MTTVSRHRINVKYKFQPVHVTVTSEFSAPNVDISYVRESAPNLKFLWPYLISVRFLYIRKLLFENTPISLDFSLSPSSCTKSHLTPSSVHRVLLRKTPLCRTHATLLRSSASSTFRVSLYTVYAHPAFCGSLIIHTDQVAERQYRWCNDLNFWVGRSCRFDQKPR